MRRAFFLVLVITISCENSEEIEIQEAEFRFCQSTPIDSLIQDTVFYSYGVTVFDGLEYTQYPFCDYEKLDSFPNYKNAIVDAYVYEDLVDDRALNKVEILTFDVIEH
jgi:hypothetical protein